MLDGHIGISADQLRTYVRNDGYDKDKGRKGVSLDVSAKTQS